MIKYTSTTGMWLSLSFFKVNDSRYPLGIKAKFVLIDIESKTPRFLVDNNHHHDSRVFHMHPELPQNSQTREALSIQDYEDAKDFFLKEVRKIINNEN